MALIASLSNVRVAHKWTTVELLFRTNAQAWTAGSDVAAARQVGTAAAESFFVKFERHLGVVGHMWGAYSVVQLVQLLATVATIPLLLTLRRQIHFSLEELAAQRSILPELEVEVGTPPRSSSASEPVVLAMPTLGALKAMAARQSTSLEAAKRLRSMARVVRDLQM